jgi:hypothetical protein
MKPTGSLQSSKKLPHMTEFPYIHVSSILCFFARLSNKNVAGLFFPVVYATAPPPKKKPSAPFSTYSGDESIHTNTRCDIFSIPLLVYLAFV